MGYLATIDAYVIPIWCPNFEMEITEISFFIT